MNRERLRYGAWPLEGLRSLIFLRPRWAGMPAGAALLLVLALSYLALAIATQRLELGDGAVFDPSGLSENLFVFLPLAWACLATRGRAHAHDGPSGQQLMALLLVQLVLMTLIGALHYTAVMRSSPLAGLDQDVQTWLWYLPSVWLLAAQVVLLWRAGASHAATVAARIAAIAVVGTGLAVVLAFDSGSWLWREPGDASQADTFTLSQEALEQQLPLLDEQLAALAPQRPGVIDTYTITFAPYEGEQVFRRESEMVSAVMASRFDAAGRGLQLINHRDTIGTRPWATPLNLERAIAGIAEVMDPREDILFIHLTSHGASDGQLAAQFAPLDVPAVMPKELKQWLDDAGIAYRVLSISACYSGSWIAPLAGPGTLAMTASDADHTSYGCGRKSDLTFFGRAMYDELLRKTTLSFEDAHAAARPLIHQREIAAGKDDGYSNPQIAVGAQVAAQLARQRAQLAASAQASAQASAR